MEASDPESNKSARAWHIPPTCAVRSLRSTAVGHASLQLKGAAEIADGDGIGGFLDPRPPAAIVDGERRPTHQIGVEEGITGAPARATVKRDAFVRADTPGVPLVHDVMIVAHGIVDVAIMVHA